MSDEEIRNLLELYQRKELDQAKMDEVQTQLESNLRWQEIQREIIAESQGIRFSQLQNLRAKLESLEDANEIIENISASVGDLSLSQAFNNETNQKTDLDIIENASLKNTNDLPSTDIIKGIRYSILNESLKKLKVEEDKNKIKGRLLYLSKNWWAVAVGIFLLVCIFWPLIRPVNYAERLIQGGFKVPLMTDIIRGGDGSDSIQMIIQKAYGAYAEGNYKMALKYFESIPLQDNENYYIYYLTTLYLNNNKKYNKVLSEAKIKFPNNQLIINLFKEIKL